MIMMDSFPVKNPRYQIQLPEHFEFLYRAICFENKIPSRNKLSKSLALLHVLLDEFSYDISPDILWIHGRVQL